MQSSAKRGTFRAVVLSAFVALCAGYTDSPFCHLMASIKRFQQPDVIKDCKIACAKYKITIPTTSVVTPLISKPSSTTVKPPANCRDPGIVRDATRSVTGFLTGGAVYVTCRPGLKMLVGNAFRICQANGAWSGRQPICGSVAGGGSCPSNFREYGGHCYIYVDPDMTWNEAKSHCNNLDGAYLAEIGSSGENAFVRGLHRWGYLWIGLRISGSRFRWDRSGDWATYTNWNTGEPSNSDKTSASEDCVELRKDRTWNDNDCNDRKGFVCEKEKGGRVI